MIVDVGGNVGTVTLALAKAFPHLRFVVQDLDQQIQAAHKVNIFNVHVRRSKYLQFYQFWQENHAEALASGRVKLEGKYIPFD